MLRTGRLLAAARGVLPALPALPLPAAARTRNQARGGQGPEPRIWGARTVFAGAGASVYARGWLASDGGGRSVEDGPENELDHRDVLTEAEALSSLLVSSASIRNAGLHPVAVLGKHRWFRRDEIEDLARHTWGSLDNIERVRRERAHAAELFRDAAAAAASATNSASASAVEGDAPRPHPPLRPPPWGMQGFPGGGGRREDDEASDSSGAAAAAAGDPRLLEDSLPFSVLRKVARRRKRRQEKKDSTLALPLKPTKSMSSSSTTVYAAMAGNVLIMAGKAVAFVLSGSGAMLSEALHSAADVANQSLLLVGIKRSQREADPSHPYGYAREANIWALISGVGTFSSAPLTELPFSLAMLSAAFAIESATLAYAARVVAADARKANASFLDYVVDGANPMAVAVLVEDSAAVAGVVIAGTAITASYLTGNPVYDSVGTLLVGALMAGCATFIIRRNMRDLVGKAMPKTSQDQILSLLEADKAVVAVHEVKAVLMGLDEIRFKAEIDFDGRQIAKHLIRKRNIDLAALMAIESEKEMEAFLVQYGDDIIEQLADEVDRIEREISRVVPEARYIDLEAH
ncbi:zinc transporter 9 [Thecamonas trahens ATCC 50062]|uniref:Zinc transporter 9 n=1 Tax=Thecamonas trahens ATCC 50062 TaxID=461836 RepID=A0A0L0D7J7_THETB|nr:zinc transporter 9 [Thecamonas trahens ATCC 50062]KNC48165.1 zinc transporter 9 [Thecamonas trahens ATCC 50062]|eukprot:XP_013758735.1 zinc transporter 9 [Thecamonas trahens ATCC 50062]